MSTAAGRQLDDADDVVASPRMTDDGVTDSPLLASSNCADDIMTPSTTKQRMPEVTAAATGCVFDVGGTNFNESNGTCMTYFMPSDTCSKTQQPAGDCPAVKPTSRDWTQFSEHQFVRLHCQQQQQQQKENGSSGTGASLTELKPIYFGPGLGSTVQASVWSVSSGGGGEALSLATADASGSGVCGGGGGGYLSMSPGGASFGLPPSYYASVYGSSYQ